MNPDIRVQTTFPHHHKTKKLRRKLGGDAVMSLVFLWVFAAENRPDGVLSGMDPDDIAIACQWDGDATSMLLALLDVGFLELVDGVYVLHDWLENNPWAAAAPARKAKASAAAKARWDKRNELDGGGSNALSIKGDAPSIKTDAHGNAPSPFPSPSPKPSPSDNNKLVPPLVLIRDLFNRCCPSFPAILDLASPSRWMSVSKLWAGHQDNDGGGLAFFEEYFHRAEASDRLTNRDGQWQGRPCTIDWLLDADNCVRLLEGLYDNGKCGKGSYRRAAAVGTETGSTALSLTDEFCQPGRFDSSPL